MTILVDGGFVYWAEEGSVNGNGTPQPDGTIDRVPVAGGAVETLATGLTSPRVLARRSGEIWLASGSDLLRLPEGGKPAVAYKGAGFAAIGASDVFYLGGFSLTTNQVILFKAPLAGGCEVPLAQLPLTTIAPVIDDARVYVALSNTLVVSVAQ